MRKVTPDSDLVGNPAFECSWREQAATKDRPRQTGLPVCRPCLEDTRKGTKRNALAFVWSSLTSCQHRVDGDKPSGALPDAWYAGSHT